MKKLLLFCATMVLLSMQTQSQEYETSLYQGGVEYDIQCEGGNCTATGRIGYEMELSGNGGAVT